MISLKSKSLFVSLAAAAMIAMLSSNAAYSLGGGLQVPDEAFSYVNDSPAYELGKGPRILIHEENSPFARDGGLIPFGKLVESDGYRIKKHGFPLDKSILAGTDIFIVANAYSRAFSRRSVLDPPSVYTDAEIQMLVEWVTAGGALLVLADHSPLGGGTKKLAEAFGFTQMSGYIIKDQDKAGDGNLYIKYQEGSGLNLNHPITNGATGRHNIKQFMTFGGQALIGPPESEQLLTIPGGYVSLLTFQLEQELNTATRIDSAGFSMGSVLEFGKGRIAIFGEAGGFTSQIFNKTHLMGFIHPDGKENPEFVLSVMRWLSRFEP